MSKELEALERIRSHNYHELPKRECLKIIETALKKYKVLQEVHKDFVDKNIKKLEAFDIIKEYEIDIPTIKESESLDDYNSIVYPIGQQLDYKEQYDLLKEVLL